MLKSLFNYLKEVRSELKKVDWPNRQEVINYTYIVVIFSAGIGLFLITIDYIFSQMLEYLIRT
jgi:preprotein translocase subunit SecE